jgi:hypothetical protein
MQQAEIIKFHTRHHFTPDCIALTQVVDALRILRGWSEIIAASSYLLDNQADLRVSGPEIAKEIALLAVNLRWEVDNLAAKQKKQIGA